MGAVFVPQDEVSPNNNSILKQVQQETSINFPALQYKKPKILPQRSFIPEPQPELPRLPIPESVQPTQPASIPVMSKTIALVKEFEGFRSQAYWDTDGTPVIGYGLSKIGGKSVNIGDRIEQNEADHALEKQLQAIQTQIEQAVTVKLNAHQLGALTSIAFNVGVEGIKNSTLLRKVNAQDYLGAANEFLRWNKANVGGRLVTLAGLSRRRQAERELFLTPVD
ncbi:glycoside hydrolase family 24 [Stanieria cyanosphaera PCC 7437]|uniref:Lysozyme n=2 Tax=Stanieria cyanosphaera TaxID=102116 RepID=K9XTT4_STAC7|nr:glycoside hydrolase family 24 [Stanieria cyanosphaera PCC 7437]